MNHAPLQHLGTWTVISSAALLLILALRPLLRRHGDAALVHASWLLLPLALLASLLPFPSGPQLAAALAQPIGMISTVLPATAASSFWPGPESWWRVWLAGTGAAALWTLGLQLRFERSLGPLQPLRATGLYLAATPGAVAATAGPLLLGLLRPRIVLPADFEQRYTPTEQALIVAHEQAHLLRGDLYAQALAAAMQVLFWFNPLVHLAAARFRYDLELACDQTVLLQNPQSQKTYAGAILKAQLVGRGAPLGCQWQSGHPLKTRIQQLARPAPQRAQRRAAQGLLAGCTLAACYGAWAAEQVGTAPPAASASAAADGSARRYRVAFEATNEVPSQSKVRMTMDLAVLAGRPTKLVLGEDTKLNCQIGLELNEVAIDRVEIKVPFQCDGGQPAHPRLITGLGQRAMIQTGSKAEGEHLYTFTVTVTPWPEGRPWPQARAASASGKPSAREGRPTD
jgi:beta-lactamase regulating signal transducer with metallopeptidase domain